MNTLNMPTHEHLRLLRNDEKVLCKSAKQELCFLWAITKKTILFVVISVRIS